MAVGFCLLLAPQLHGQPPVNTLVITGAAPYGYHPWKRNMERIEPRLDAFNIAQLSYLKARGLDEWREWEGNYSEYDAVMIIYYWAQAPKEELTRLERFVEEGGGLVVAHSALAGFWKQERFDGLTGIAYREHAPEYGHSLAFNNKGERIIRPPGEGDGSAHAPIARFQIQTHDTEHPITDGLPDVWMQSKDELYYNLRGPNTNLRVLAVAEGPNGTHSPQAWIRKHGNGRVFCLTPGHHQPGASSVGFVTMLARGIEWAATGKVTLPVPSNFPKEEQAVTEIPRFED